MLAGAAAGYVDVVSGYTRIQIENKAFLGHIIAWTLHYGEWPKEQIDHRDMVRTNNAIKNIRLASRSQNCANSGATVRNKSGVKGVHWSNHNKKWVASIQVRKTKKHLGFFEKIEDAAAAYQRAAIDGFGEFARIA